MLKKVDETAQKVFWNHTSGRRSPYHPVVAAFADPKVEFIRSCIENECGKDKIKQILDVGSGNGFFTYPLTKWASCTALDFSERMLELNPVEEATKICGNALNMDFDDNSFDLVFCSNLLHHVPDPSLVIQEMARVSKRYVALCEPNRNNPLMFSYSLIKSIERGVLKFSQDYLLKLASEAKLKPIAIKSMGNVLPNKTPVLLLPLFKACDFEWPIAFYNILVCELTA